MFLVDDLSLIPCGIMQERRQEGMKGKKQKDAQPSV